MSNIRPWFRLSSIARPTSQGSTDPPPPPPPRPTPRRPIVVRPPPKQPSPPRQQTPPPSRQQSPPPSRQQTPPPPPPPRSQFHSPPSRYMSPPTPSKAATPPPPPPRLSYTPPPSLKEVQEALPPRKPNSPPSPVPSTRSIKEPSPHKILSPYSLPPSQLLKEHETTQKNILTVEKTSQVLHNHNQTHQNNNTKKTRHQSSSSESENIMGTKVITIAGENKGAVMEILRNKPKGAGIHSSEVLNGTGEKGRRLQSSSSSEEGEGTKKKTTKNPKNGDNSNLPMKAFTNSNVQMINNSIVYNSTATHHDPGVHLKIYRKHGSGNGFYVKDYGNNGSENNN